MRILMVSEDIPAKQVGGLGKHVVTLGNKLIEAGHEVDLMGRDDLDYQAHAAEIGFHGTFVPGFSLERAGWKEAQLGVWMPYKRQSLARRIEKAIAEHAGGYGLIHYHGHLPLVGLGLPKQLPLLQTRHDQGSECLTHIRFRAGEVCNLRADRDCAICRSSSPNAVQVQVSAFAVRQFRRDVADNYAQRTTLFVSEFLREQFRRTVPHAELGRSHVLHNFIDLARLNRLTMQAGPPVGGTVLLAGRVDESKGFKQFLEAWQLAGTAAKLMIVGDGPLRPELETRYSDQAEFLGWTPYDRTMVLTKQAHVCVVPSVLEESCGTTILEALALGRPCIALRRGGTPELQRYERYPGQLRLADSMDELVLLTGQALSESIQELAPATHSDADVASMLPRLLSIYEQVRGDVPGPSE